MNKSMLLRGKVWVIADGSGKLIDDVDTDMIFHNAHLAITDISKMGPYAFGNLGDWTDFPKKTQKGDILILGKNFGAGSSRQQAVDCFTALGTQVLLAESFGAIYKRNAINCGMPILASENLFGTAGKPNFANGDEVEVNLETGVVKNLTRNVSVTMNPFSNVQRDIYQSGGLYAYGKTLEVGK